MIKQFRSGQYKLTETKHHIKVLELDKAAYAWIEPPSIGGILVSSRHSHRVDAVLSVGAYALFDVEDESELSDQMHLQLEVGIGVWQGYLLPTGLPNDKKIRSRIIPTQEVIMPPENKPFQISKTAEKNKAAKE
jgi:hypothetical protein